MIEKHPSCNDAFEPDLLPVETARQRLFAALKPTQKTETIALDQAMGRVLSTEIRSPLDVPAQTNSAMDGYAISSQSIPGHGEAQLQLRGTAWAGKPFKQRVEPGEAVRIFTGAIMPDGTDTVVIQEQVRVHETAVDIDSDAEPGRNVRQAGEDVRAGQCVMPAGRRLEAADIGVIASLGIAEVATYQPLTVAFFTTGDELQSLDAHVPGEPLPEGMLFDSNRYTLMSLLQSLGVNTVDLGIVRDTEEATRNALQNAAEQADVVISSGGVSAGDADYVARVFRELGAVSFWKLAMRPGRPLAFGTIGQSAFFGLPGNPVAVMVTFLQFVQPAIRYLSGMPDIQPITLPVRCLSVLRKSPGRVEYQRGVLSLSEDGQLVVRSTGKQGAGRLSSMSEANCLIVLDAERGRVEPGECVAVQPFRGLLN